MQVYPMWLTSDCYRRAAMLNEFPLSCDYRWKAAVPLSPTHRRSTSTLPYLTGAPIQGHRSKADRRLLTIATPSCKDVQFTEATRRTAAE
jgi:hypothetical protein